MEQTISTYLKAPCFKNAQTRPNTHNFHLFSSIPQHLAIYHVLIYINHPNYSLCWKHAWSIPLKLHFSNRFSFSISNFHLSTNWNFTTKGGNKNIRRGVTHYRCTFKGHRLSPVILPTESWPLGILVTGLVELWPLRQIGFFYLLEYTPCWNIFFLPSQNTEYLYS